MQTIVAIILLLCGGLMGLVYAYETIRHGGVMLPAREAQRMDATSEIIGWVMIGAMLLGGVYLLAPPMLLKVC